MSDGLTPSDISDYVFKNGGPRQVSLDSFTHLFLFTDGEVDDARIVFFNKNGNFGRVIRDDRFPNVYNVYKTWTGFTVANDWEKTRLQANSPSRALQKCSIGPGTGKKEQLTYFPKGAFKGSRRICFRDKVLRAQTSGDTTTIIAPDNDAFPIQGKAWESEEAIKWCLAKFCGVGAIPQPDIYVNPVEAAAALQKSIVALQDNPLWGAF